MPILFALAANFDLLRKGIGDVMGNTLHLSVEPINDLVAGADIRRNAVLGGQTGNMAPGILQPRSIANVLFGVVLSRVTLGRANGHLPQAIPNNPERQSP